MAQSGYTPILIYGSGTTGNAPSAGNLTSSSGGAELALNYFDGKLFYKDAAGVVQILASKATGVVGGSDTQIQYNDNGVLAGSADLTFDGTEFVAVANAGIGVAPLAGTRLYVGGTHPSSSNFTQVVRVSGTLPSTSTTEADVFVSRPVTATASYTLSNLIHFKADPDTFGAGSSVTAQVGFLAQNTLTAAQNNYGFYADLPTQSAVAISSISGTGSTVTVDTSSAHGLTTGDLVLIVGVSDATMTSGSYNGGPYSVNVSDADTFTFSSTATSSGAVSGSGNTVRANRWNMFAAGTGQNYFGGPVIISANSVLDGLRITQVGSGNALVVEDSANPDTSPFVVSAAGNVGVGVSVPTNKLEVAGNVALSTGNLTFSSTAQRITGDMTNATEANRLLFQSSTTNGNTNLGIAPNGTATTGAVRVYGVSGVANSIVGQLSAISTAEVRLNSTKTGTASYAPLTFYTNNSEQMRIDTTGNVGIGSTGLAAVKLFIGGTHPSSSSNTQVVRASGTLPSATTNEAILFLSRPVTATASYTLSSLVHFYANPDTFGVGSTVSNQYGFVAESTITAATSNFGFYGNIASGSNRWNFYANGTAANYFAGEVRVGNTSAIGGNMSVWNGLHVGANDSNAEIQIRRASDNSGGSFLYLNKARGTIASSTIVVVGDDVGSIVFRGYDGSAYRVAAQVLAQVDGTPGASDMPGRLIFLTTPDGTATAQERMRITSAGNVGIGTASPDGKLHVAVSSSGNVDPALILANPILNSAGTGADLRFYVNDGGSARYAAVRSVQATSGNVADLRFLTSNADVPAVRMTITPAGNVGVGISSPTQALDVSGSVQMTGACLLSDNQRVQWGTSNSAYIVGKQGGSGTGLVKIGANGDIVYITAAGNVGINEAAPDYVLDVNGSFGFTPGSSVTPVDNGDVVIEATNNTTLTFKLKGSDGTVRTGTITLS